MDVVTLLEIIRLIWPLLVIEGVIRIYCLVLIWRQGVRNLSKWGWTALVLVVNLFGWAAFLTLGRKSA